MAITKKTPIKSKPNPAAAKAAPKPISAPAKTAAVKKPVVAAPAANTAPQPKRITFKVRANPDSVVSVAGDFNKWDAAANPLTDSSGTGDFSTAVTLTPGTYEYKFVINGTWCVDPDCTEWAQNSMGTLNSVCKV